MLSTLDIVTYIVFAGFAVAYGYVAYTAIATRRALSNRVYRNQALGLAVFALLLVEWALATVLGSVTFPGMEFTGIADAIQLLAIWFAILIGFYYYVDASIMATRPTDPLFRDTFHWTRLRLAFWVYDIGAAIVFSAAAAVNIYNYENGGILPFLQAGVPLLIVIFCGAVVLPIAIRRSKDKVLKRQLTWFAAYMIWLGLLVVGGSFLPTLPEVVTLAVFLAGAYPLYRSASSLVPLYRFNSEAGKSESPFHTS
jgi:hypothetical protein